MFQHAVVKTIDLSAHFKNIFWSRKTLRACLILVPLLGVQKVLFPYRQNHIAYRIIVAIVNSYQVWAYFCFYALCSIYLSMLSVAKIWTNIIEIFFFTKLNKPLTLRHIGAYRNLIHITLLSHIFQWHIESNSTISWYIVSLFLIFS